MLTKSFLELGERDAAIASAERAVAIDPQNSVYHEWLGKAYGEKADAFGDVYRARAGEEDASGV